MLEMFLPAGWWSRYPEFLIPTLGPDTDLKVGRFAEFLQGHLQDLPAQSEAQSVVMLHYLTFVLALAECGPGRARTC